MYKYLRYRYYMWRLARYIRKLQREQKYATRFHVERDYDEYEQSRTTRFILRCDRDGFSALQLAQSLVDDYPSWEWMRINADNLFKALNEFREEWKLRNAWCDEELLAETFK